MRTEMEEQFYTTLFHFIMFDKDIEMEDSETENENGNGRTILHHTISIHYNVM